MTADERFALPFLEGDQSVNELMRLPINLRKQASTAVSKQVAPTPRGARLEGTPAQDVVERGGVRESIAERSLVGAVWRRRHRHFTTFRELGELRRKGHHGPDSLERFPTRPRWLFHALAPERGDVGFRQRGIAACRCGRCVATVRQGRSTVSPGRTRTHSRSPRHGRRVAPGGEGGAKLHSSEGRSAWHPTSKESAAIVAARRETYCSSYRRGPNSV